MKVDYENKLITLSDGYQYVVLEKINLDGKEYVLANEVEDGDLGENVTIFEVKVTDKGIIFNEEKNIEIAETVLAKMAHI